ncbi:hypothetical protein L6452_43240 [Arctium lappa]|uniref:Uncharacterized protein n=1 Tax=Arctium lappa TaxID=4217 RepID=A0ACB8XLA0_ARCLA|nr:hypothetical protein L6452_43240 [Arctium lappa]
MPTQNRELSNDFYNSKVAISILKDKSLTQATKDMHIRVLHQFSSTYCIKIKEKQQKDEQNKRKPTCIMIQSLE